MTDKIEKLKDKDIMADQQVKVVIQGEDKTGAAFKSATKNTSDFSKQASDLSKVIGGGLLAGGAALTAFLYSSAKGAAQAEASMARVTATLTAMGPAALKNKDALLEMSQAAIKLGFDDEAAAESISRFYQATNSLTEAQKLNNLAMDLAAAKNLDLATATGLVNQVLSGGGRVLKQYQIAVDETKTPLEQLAQLQGVVAGQAEAHSKTFEGQMAVLSESVSNLKDTIGAALLEAILPFIKDLAEWASNPDVQNKVKEIATIMGNFAKTVIPVVIDAIKIMVGWFKFWYNMLVDIEVQIFKIVDALNKMIERAKAAASAVGSALKSGPSGIISGAGAELKHLLTGKASGGPVSGGTPYMVGERGPELFVPATSGTIIPNGGGGAVINIFNPVLLDDTMVQKLGAQIMRVVGQDLRY